MNKLVFIFISKRINIEDIYNYLCHNGWINKDSNINIHKISKEELNNYNISTDGEAVGIYEEDISIDIIINNNYRKVFESDEDDIIIYSLISRKINNYEYIPYVTSEVGLKYNFYNIEKEYHKLAYKDSFIYHYEKSYEGYLLNIIEIKNSTVLNTILANKRKKDSYKLELISDINNLEDAISYIFSINKYRDNSFELIDQDENLYIEIDKLVKKVEFDYGRLVSFYEIDSDLADVISSFSININMWCLVFKNNIIIIDYGTYE